MLPTRFIAALAIFLVAGILAVPVPEDSIEEFHLERVPRSTRSKLPGKKHGVVKHFKHKKLKINVQVQLKTKDGYHEICLRVFHDSFPSHPVKPCIGIKHIKNDDDSSSLPYRFRVNRWTIVTEEIKLKTKITTCKNVNLASIVKERICFKDFLFRRKSDSKHGKVTEVCITLGFKSIGRTFEVCGSFQGSKLVAHKFKPGKYVESDLSGDSEGVTVIEE